MRYAPGLSGAQARLYDMIVRHFLASFHQDCEYSVTTVTFDVAGELFYGEGVRCIEKVAKHYNFDIHQVQLDQRIMNLSPIV